MSVHACVCLCACVYDCTRLIACGVCSTRGMSEMMSCAAFMDSPVHIPVQGEMGTGLGVGTTCGVALE